MDLTKFLNDYPARQVKDYIEFDVEGMSVEEAREVFGLPKDEFEVMLEQHKAAAEPLDADDEDCDESPVADDLPRKFYAVRVLSYGEVPYEALRRFAGLYPDHFVQGDFWLPSSRRVYQSLSGAQGRADLLAFNGVECEVVETVADWRTYETLKEHVARLERENAELKAQLGVS